MKDDMIMQEILMKLPKKNTTSTNSQFNKLLDIISPIKYTYIYWIGQKVQVFP